MKRRSQSRTPRSRAAKGRPSLKEAASSVGPTKKILSEAEVHLMTQCLKAVLAIDFPGIPKKHLERVEDAVRTGSLSRKLGETREAMGLTIKEAAARLKVPQYRLRDVEKAWTSRMIPEIFERYIELLGLRDWVAEWIKANSELAERMRISGRRLP